MIHESADVADTATVSESASVWHLAQVREGASVGDDCVVGRGVYIGPGVSVGPRTKIQNFAQVYDPARLGAGVFIGPAVVLTNDVYPRSVDVDGELKRADGWDSTGVTVADGASIGARAVVLAGVTVGEWALVGAGTTVIRDVPPYALVVGNPGRQVGWVGRAGRRLEPAGDRRWRCPDTGEEYVETADGLTIDG
ncbi:MAG: acyltransferase [Ilumatobacter sp.]|uniref:acyltransferase n=1 Tax=Ilumatobacter sp. TaxID=1967498 RepID=UPI002631D8EF|nr:acyltransferase [Ilumatobacter sp.]MDJ0768361.1 acyltransferase [Ilumatobacter sp.]